MNSSHSTAFEENLQALFRALSEKIFSRLNIGEHLRLSLHAEQTQFTRLSGGRVRQNGVVEDMGLSVQFISPKQSVADLSVSFAVSHDGLPAFAERLLGKARGQIRLCRTRVGSGRLSEDGRCRPRKSSCSFTAREIVEARRLSCLFGTVCGVRAFAHVVMGSSV